MICANSIAVRLGMLTVADAQRIASLIGRAGLPTSARFVDPRRVYEAHLFDKKFSGRANRFVLPSRIGLVRVTTAVAPPVIKAAIEEACSGKKRRQ